MTYSPVCIPTLNRYEHLRKCLESLSHCTWADQTEVYVALDYPPTNQWDKYAPGWEKNREFLRTCGNMGFKKLHVIERKVNYGIWTNPVGKPTNLGALIDEYIKGKFDFYIITEDDNVFAPSFLDYMNKGNEKFKDDETVSCIGGYRLNGEIKFDNNTFFRQNAVCEVWGLGQWTSKNFVDEIGDYKYYRNTLSFHNLVKIYHNGGSAKLVSYIGLMNHTFNGKVIDVVKAVYMMLNDQYEILPTRSLVNNIGLTSGENYAQCSTLNLEELYNTRLPQEKLFEFIGTGYEYQEQNQSMYRKSNPNHIGKKLIIKRMFKNIVKYFVYG